MDRPTRKDLIEAARELCRTATVLENDGGYLDHRAAWARYLLLLTELGVTK